MLPWDHHHVPPPLGRSHFQGPQWPSHKAQKAGLSSSTVDLHFAPNPHQAVGQPRLRANQTDVATPATPGPGLEGPREEVFLFSRLNPPGLDLGEIRVCCKHLLTPHPFPLPPHPLLNYLSFQPQSPQLPQYLVEV